MTTQTESGALAQAARAAGFAPSIHNTQPWRWVVDGATLELHAARERQLGVTDPAGRMLAISCGAALHHARVALAAEGWAADIERMPDPARPDLLARLTVTGRTAVTAVATRLLQTVHVRHTDRRPVSDTPVEADTVEALRQVAAAEGVHLHVLRRDDVVTLASEANRAQSLEGVDDHWREELAYWAGGARDTGLGVPDTAIPASPPATTVPGRDFGAGTLPIGPGHDRAAVYAILYADDESPVGWLRGGEALSALWLVAIEHGMSVLPLSAAVEVASTRIALRHMLADLGEPLLVLRLGIADPDHAGPPHTPRLPAEQVLEIHRG